jgi:nucleoside recognition membrane protein YjiH
MAAQQAPDKDVSTAALRAPMWKFFVYSLIGATFFFVPMTINGDRSILLDHIVTAVRQAIPDLLPYYALILLAAGAAYPFAAGTWRRSRVTTVFSAFKVAGFAVGLMLVFEVGPAWLFEPDMGPFLLESLVIPVGLLVPIGAVFLAMLVGYGLMEFVGVLLQRVMRPLWRTPGRSAVDAAASFVGSYSLGLLITDRVYRSGRYTGREAAIIAVGFSTVSVTFMVVIANTLDLMGIWLTYFFLTFFVTYAVTAIVVRIPPLSRVPDEPFPEATPQPEEQITGNRIGRAWEEARTTLRTAPSLPRNVWANFTEGLRMSMSILPSIMSVGTIGLLLAHFTPVFDLLAYVFWPFTRLVGLSDPMLAAKALSVGIAEVFLPATMAAGSEDLVLRLVVGVVSVSAIIFFSALVPCVLATRIPLTMGRLVVIWFQRVVLSILIAGPLAYLLVGL